MVKPIDRTQQISDDTSTAGSEQSQQRTRYMTAVGATQRSTTPNKNTKKESSKYFLNNHGSSPGLEKKNSVPQSLISILGSVSNVAQQPQQPTGSSLDIFKKVRDECSYKYFLCA